MDGTPVVRRAGLADWQRVRDVRLAALQNSPSAFTSTYEREVGFDEATWRSRVQTAAWFLAYEEERAIGVVAGIHEEHASEQERHVVSFWVAPEHRNQGVAGLLLAAIVNWAREDGALLATLWVVDGNEPAARLYERHGFRPTGERQLVPGSTSTFESKWGLRLSSCG